MSLGNLSMTPTSAIAEGDGVGDLVISIVVGPICYDRGNYLHQTLTKNCPRSHYLAVEERFKKNQNPLKIEGFGGWSQADSNR